jgi:uncharacterized membrane protein
MNFEFIAYARKFLIALAAALGVLGAALSDGTVIASEWVSISLAFLGALGVYYTTNDKSNTERTK